MQGLSMNNHASQLTIGALAERIGLNVTSGSHAPESLDLSPNERQDAAAPISGIVVKSAHR